MKNWIYSIILVLLLSCNFAGKSFAQEVSSQETAISENYLSFEFARNLPAEDSQKEFATGDVTTYFGFRHTLADKWMMGVHAGFKRLSRRSDQADVTLFSISQESMYLYRLNYPIYAGIGPKLMYILPTKAKKLPPERNNEYNREIGAALSMALYYTISRDFILNLRVDRWRGLNTKIFDAYETAIGLSYALP